MFLLRLMGQWYQQKKSTCLLEVTPITSEEIQQFLELFLFSLIESESRSRRTCWFSLGIKAFSKTNDIFCMRNGMAFALLTVPLMLFIRVLDTKKPESTDIKVTAGLGKR